MCWKLDEVYCEIITTCNKQWSVKFDCNVLTFAVHAYIADVALLQMFDFDWLTDNSGIWFVKL